MKMDDEGQGLDVAPALRVWTLVAWLVLLSVGGVGAVCGYPRPATLERTESEVVVERLELALAPEQRQQPVRAPRTEDAAAAPSQVSIPEVPPLPSAVVVSEPIQPVTLASRVMPASPLERGGEVSLSERTSPSEIASPAALKRSPPAPESARPPAPVVETLSFGVGAGLQPAPEYPAVARSRRQQGTVVVRLEVASDGRVTGVEVAAPSPWPLLNEAALRVVRERWRFDPGAPHRYEVAIRFELLK